MADLESACEMLYVKLPVPIADKLTALTSTFIEEHQEQMVWLGLNGCLGLNIRDQREMVEMFEKYSKIEGFDTLLLTKITPFKLKEIIKEMQDEKTYNLLMDSNKPDILMDSLKVGHVDLEKISYTLKKFEHDDLEAIADCNFQLASLNAPKIITGLFTMLDKYDHKVVRFCKTIEKYAEEREHVIALEKLFTEHSDRECIREVAEMICYAENAWKAAAVISGTFDELDKYQDKSDLYRVISDFINVAEYWTAENIISALKYCGKDHIREFIEPNTGFIHSVLLMGLKTNYHVLDKCIEVSNKYEGGQRIFKALRRAVDKSEKIIHTVIEIFDKYHDNHGECLIPLIDNNIALDYDELMSDSCYNAVKNSRDPYAVFDRIVTNKYSTIRGFIDDIPFGEQLSYNDLDVINEAINFAEEIHKNKSDDLQWKVKKGFLNEMNRAIKQGSDYKTKLRNLKSYCFEVKKNLRENASDLMVVYDG